MKKPKLRIAAASAKVDGSIYFGVIKHQQPYQVMASTYLKSFRG